MEHIRAALRLAPGHISSGPDRPQRAEARPWVDVTLTSLRYEARSRAEKGDIRTFLVLTTGYSRAQIERYIRLHRTTADAEPAAEALRPDTPAAPGGDAVSPVSGRRPHVNVPRLHRPGFARGFMIAGLLTGVFGSVAFLSSLTATALLECRTAVAGTDHTILGPVRSPERSGDQRVGGAADVAGSAVIQL